MKKILGLLTAVLVTASVSSYATSNEDVLDIDTYNKHISDAMELYQASDYDAALPLIEVSAMRGDKTSQYVLGTMYLNGQGTEQDLIKSYSWLTVANEQKSPHWKKPLEMLDEKLPADFLDLAKTEAEKYVEQFGVKTQQLKCRNIKTLGSKKGSHLCLKSEVKPGYYYVSSPTLLVSK